MLIEIFMNYFVDGYFDSEDPSVNLHEFIVNSMQAQK